LLLHVVTYLGHVEFFFQREVMASEIEVKNWKLIIIIRRLLLLKQMVELKFSLHLLYLQPRLRDKHSTNYEVPRYITW
jgi:hypothetical protein